MINVHNSFSISVKGKRVTGYNSVLIQPAKTIFGNGAFGGFIRVHLLDGSVRSFAARTVSLNANRAKGRLYAEHAVTLDAAALTDQTIVALALSDDGIREINFASLPPLQKKQEEVEITAMVFLTEESKNAALVCSDDNPLVRALLGAQRLSDNAYVQWGTCETPPGSAVTETIEKTQNRIPATVVSTAKGIDVLAELPDQASDAVLFFDEKPALRISVGALTASTYTIQSTVTPEATVEAPYPVFSVLSASVGAQQFTGVEAHGVPKKLIRTPGGSLLTSFGRDLKLLSDPSCQRAAFVSDKELYLIGEQNGRLTVLGALEISGKMPHLISGTEVALIDDNAAEIYRYSEPDGFIKILEKPFVNKGTANSAASKLGGNYTVVRLRKDGFIERGEFTATAAHAVRTTLTANGAALIFRNRYGTCAVGSVSIRVWKNNAEEPTVASVMTRLRNNYGAQIEAGGDGLIFVTHPDDPAFRYVYSLAADTGFLVPEHAAVRLCGDFFIQTDLHGNKKIFYYYRHGIQPISVSVPNPETVEELIRVGAAVLVRRENGEIEEYAVESDQSFLYHPLFTAGSTLNCSVHGSASVPAVRRRLTVSIE